MKSPKQIIIATIDHYGHAAAKALRYSKEQRARGDQAGAVYFAGLAAAHVSVTCHLARELGIASHLGLDHPHGFLKHQPAEAVAC